MTAPASPVELPQLPIPDGLLSELDLRPKPFVIYEGVTIPPSTGGGTGFSTVTESGKQGHGIFIVPEVPIYADWSMRAYGQQCYEAGVRAGQASKWKQLTEDPNIQDPPM